MPKRTPESRTSTRHASKLKALMAGPLACLAVLVSSAPFDLPEPAWRLVGLSLWMVIWWLSEAAPLPATALLPLPLMPLLSISDEATTAANYADPLIFLFLGGFLIAAAIQRWNLHRRIALTIVHLVGTSPARIVGGFMLASAFLSMWISNTATAVMMFSVGLSLIEYLGKTAPNKTHVRNFGVALMLGVAYSASIGGVATLIGTPPNALLAGFVSNAYGFEIGFSTWMLIGLPLTVVMLPLVWLWLTRIAFPLRGFTLGTAPEVIKTELRDLGKISRGERLVLTVFVLTAAAWIFRGLIVSVTGLSLSDSAIAVASALVLFALPVSVRDKVFVLHWEQAVKVVPWGILLLFGGGLALAGAFQSTGLAAAIGQGVAQFEGVGIWWLVLLVAVVTIFLTELTSNTATAATFLPIMGAVAVGLGEHPLLLTVPVALAASMAFMMPIATPPNAIVFAYEELTIRDMARTGFVLNILTIGLVVGSLLFLVPWVFGI